MNGQRVISPDVIIVAGYVRRVFEANFAKVPELPFEDCMDLLVDSVPNGKVMTLACAMLENLLLSTEERPVMTDTEGGKLSAELTDSTGPILSLPVPDSLFSLAAMMNPWFNGKCLALYEGPLDYPDPARLNHIIAKFDIQAVLLEDSSSIDVEYLGFLPGPSLNTLLTSEKADRNKVELAYPGVHIVNITL